MLIHIFNQLERPLREYEKKNLDESQVNIFDEDNLCDCFDDRFGDSIDDVFVNSCYDSLRRKKLDNFNLIKVAIVSRALSYFFKYSLNIVNIFDSICVKLLANDISEDKVSLLIDLSQIASKNKNSLAALYYILKNDTFSDILIHLLNCKDKDEFYFNQSEVSLVCEILLQGILFFFI